MCPAVEFVAQRTPSARAFAVRLLASLQIDTSVMIHIRRKSLSQPRRGSARTCAAFAFGNNRAVIIDTRFEISKAQRDGRSLPGRPAAGCIAREGVGATRQLNKVVPTNCVNEMHVCSAANLLPCVHAGRLFICLPLTRECARECAGDDEGNKKK